MQIRTERLFQYCHLHDKKEQNGKCDIQLQGARMELIWVALNLASLKKSPFCKENKKMEKPRKYKRM